MYQVGMSHTVLAVTEGISKNKVVLLSKILLIVTAWGFVLGLGPGAKLATPISCSLSLSL